jgi:hypothetical protein
LPSVKFEGRLAAHIMHCAAIEGLFLCPQFAQVRMNPDINKKGKQCRLICSFGRVTKKKKKKK